MDNTSVSSPSAKPNSRLASLDILRGFDLFLLVFFQPILVDWGRHLNLSWMAPILYQFDHAKWFGFRFWDLVMPLFLFMTGASMPFSLARYCEQSDKRPAHKKIFHRFLILFLLGMVVQGNLLGLDPNRIYFYVNLNSATL